ELSGRGRPDPLPRVYWTLASRERHGGGILSDKRLFGTDGIRGVAGQFPLDPDTVKKTGFALATVLATAGGKARVLVGRDTRESGPAIEHALTLALPAGDVKMPSCAILSTPAVAPLT